jgi:hypothetical protein
MGRSDLVPRHIDGDPTNARVLVQKDSLQDSRHLRIPPDDGSLVGHVLAQQGVRQPDGSYIVPVEKPNGR